MAVIYVALVIENYMIAMKIVIPNNPSFES